MKVRVIGYEDGMSIGSGLDMISNDIKISKAVKGKVGIPNKNARGGSGMFFSKITETTKEFEEALGISSHTKARIFKTGAEAKFDFKRQCNVNNHSVFILICFSIENAFETYVDNVSFTEDAYELLKLKKMDRFRERFGNCFIGGMRMGGEFCAAIKITHSDVEFQREIAAELNGSFTRFMKTKNKVTHEVKEKMSKASIEVFVSQQGGLLKSVQDPDSLFEQVDNAIKQITTQGLAIPFEVTLEDYSELELPGDDISFIQKKASERKLDELGDHIKTLEDRQGDIEFILKHPDYFEPFRKQPFVQESKKISKKINKIIEVADLIVRDPSTKGDMDISDCLDLKLPKRKRKRRKRRLKNKKNNIALPLKVLAKRRARKKKAVSEEPRKNRRNPIRTNK